MKDEVFHTNTTGVRPLSSVLKTLDMLDRLGSSQRPMRLIEVATAAKMSRATAHQKLITLVKAGWVEQSPDSSYRLTFRAARFGIAALSQASLGERIVPFLQKLVAEAGETVSLAVIDGAQARIVQRVESNGILRAELHVGSLLDLEHSASGRVLVAFAGPELLVRLQRLGAPLPGPKLIAQVRREHFAASSGKSYAGVRGVAAPVFDAGGACIAAVSLVGPLPRFSIEKTRPPLLRAAEAINEFIRGEKP
jgi:DNA-binding IclR family transcriptional regulator